MASPARIHHSCAYRARLRPAARFGGGGRLRCSRGLASSNGSSGRLSGRLGGPLFQQLVDLVATPGLKIDFDQSAADLAVWRRSLARGLVPEEELAFPPEPFMGSWKAALLVRLPHVTQARKRIRLRTAPCA